MENLGQDFFLSNSLKKISVKPLTWGWSKWSERPLLSLVMVVGRIVVVLEVVVPASCGLSSIGTVILFWLGVVFGTCHHSRRRDSSSNDG